MLLTQYPLYSAEDLELINGGQKTVLRVIARCLSLTRLSVLCNCLLFSWGHSFFNHSYSIIFFPLWSATISTFIGAQLNHAAVLWGSAPPVFYLFYHTDQFHVRQYLHRPAKYNKTKCKMHNLGASGERSTLLRNLVLGFSAFAATIRLDFIPENWEGFIYQTYF